MKPAFVLPPTADVIEAVAAHLVPDGDRDFRRCRVVFPGRRPAHFLRAALARRVGGSFLPPIVQNIDELAQGIAERHQSSSVRAIDQLDGASILFDIHRSMSERIGGEHFLQLERFLPLGLRLFSELEELTLSMAPPALVREKTSFVSTGELHLIAEIAERFTIELDRRELTTRARQYAIAATEFIPTDLDGARQMVLAGFFGLTPAEQMLLCKIADVEESAFFFTEGPRLRDKLERIGLSWEGGPEVGGGRWEVGEGIKDRGPRVRLTESPDVHGQVFAVAADLHDRLASNEPPGVREVIVVSQPETLFPLLHQALHQLPEEMYNISLGYPLKRTPLAGLFHRLHELAATDRGGRLSVEAYLRVLLHPYVKGLLYGRRTDVSRALIHAIESWLADTKGRTAVTLDEIESNGALITEALFRLPEDAEITPDQLSRHLKELHDLFFRSWRGRGTVGAFAVSVADLVQALHDRTTASQHSHFRRFAETFERACRDLERSLLADRSFPTDDLYFELLGRVLSTSSVPFPGSPLHGLQVLGLLETRSLRFDRVTILDANDDVIPGRGGADALLPQKVRSALGMDTPQVREEIVEYYMTALIKGAKEVRFLSVTGGGKERSRIIERLVWEAQRGAGGLQHGVETDAVRYRIALDQRRPEPVAKPRAVVDAIRRRPFTATSLDSYLACPLKFYYEHVLRLREREEAGEDIDRSQLGQLVHRVLQLFFQEWKGRPLDPARLDAAAMERLATTAFEERFGRGESVARELVLEQVVRRLVEYVKDYQVPAAESSRIEILELEKNEEATLAGARFQVRIDRLEQRTESDAEPTLHIIDYKTGGKPNRMRIQFKKLDPADRATWSKAIGSMQLGLYALVMAEVRGLRPETIMAQYHLLGRRSMSESIETGLFDKDEVEPVEGIAKVRTVVGGLVREILDPDVSFEPTHDLEKHCPQCMFNAICGTSWTQGTGEF
jgi:CRISPR/Cas system-associated exonuclease Cas4 (RecB family)